MTIDEKNPMEEYEREGWLSILHAKNVLLTQSQKNIAT
jgi:hypothetical protein